MKTILILGAGLEQSLAIKEAKNLGYKTIAFDGNPEAYGKNISDHFECIDIRDKNAVLEKARNLKIDGIFCHGVEMATTTSYVAEELGLPSVSHEAAEMCTNKHLRIKTLHANKIPCANYAFANDADEAKKICFEFPLPFIIKPTGTSGARGVQIVKTREEITVSIEYASIYAGDDGFLIEEILSGPELSTESVVYNGEIHTFCIADRNYGDSDYFKPFIIENGINFPTKLDKKIINEVHKLIENTIKALGIEFGAAKGDIIIDKGIPKIIEMSARTSGGWLCAGSIKYATGVNVLKPLLQMHVGDAISSEDFRPKFQKACAQRYWIPRDNFILGNVSYTEPPTSGKIEMFETFFPKKGQLIEKCRNHSMRYAQVICTADDINQAIESCNAVLNSINVEKINVN